MPNIIEQQDLLKGIPDNRLAMLLQNPVGDIPPFLVAAEAQRRQAIRQQFSQNGNNESVVDSLTRQLSPQRVQGNAQPTPPVPATPNMQGVAALQQQQQMMQMAQQAQQQGMAGGGPVRRFASRGYVKPTVETMSAQYFPDPFGIPDVGPDAETDWLRDYVPVPDLPPLPGINNWKTREQIEREAEKQKAAAEAASPSYVSPNQAGAYKQAYESGYRGIGVMPGAQSQLGQYYEMNRRDMEAAARREAGKNQPDLPPPPEDEDRKRLAELYDREGPSDWEKSQKWFAMAQQFLDPSKTTMESVAGAGEAFAGAMSEQERAERLARLDKEKALYEYDIKKASSARDSALSERKVRTDIATQRLDDMNRRFYEISDKIERVRDDAQKSGIDPNSPEIVARIDRLQREQDALGAGIASYETYLQSNYGFETIPTVDTANNRIR